MSELSQSRRLRTKLRLAEPRLAEVARRFWGQPRLAEAYPDFLFLVHSMIRTSVPLMREAAETARGLAPSDPLGAPLAAYYERHAREELHHDDWVLDDLEALGIGRGEVLARRPSTAVAALVGAHYYWVRHVHPVALLGYLAVLEGNPPDADHLDEVRRRTGLPEAAFRTLTLHAHLDQHHRDDLWDEIDRLALTPDTAGLLAVAAFHTIEQVSLGLEEILVRHPG